MNVFYTEMHKRNNYYIILINRIFDIYSRNKVYAIINAEFVHSVYMSLNTKQLFPSVL